jgi:hypothetical protein
MLMLALESAADSQHVPRQFKLSLRVHFSPQRCVCLKHQRVLAQHGSWLLQIRTAKMPH